MSSLLDAMLLEAYHEPKEVWIAARTDGIKGTGTQSDPFNGSSGVTPTVVINELKKDATDPTKAVVTTNGAHGFATGDLVTIGGVDIQLANLGDNYYVGTFEINVTGSTSFEYGMLRFGIPFEPFSGTAPAPPGGSIRCWREREQLDVVMRDVPSNAMIHIGPGVFETKGSNGIAPGGWTGKSGQRIVGSGMGITTLKVVNAAAVAWVQFAIVATNVDGFEVSDLTVDCNVDSQLTPHANCGAISLTGIVRHARVRRVRAINFGSKGPMGPLATAYAENFVFFIGGTDVMNVVCEDCIAEQPSPNIYWNSTIFLLGGSESGISTYHRGCAFRNNYVNCEIVYGAIVAVQSIGYDSGTNIATITTKWPHGLTAPGNVSVQGVLVNGSIDNAFNGVFAIELQTSGTQVTFRPYAADGPTATGLSVSADAAIGASVSPHLQTIEAGVSSYKIARVAPGSKTFRVATVVPHNRTENNVVKVQFVKVNGLDADDPLNPFNGAFPIAFVHSKREFEYTVVGSPPADPLTFNLDTEPAVGEGHAGFTVDTGTVAVMEGNRIFHCETGGPWHDTGSTRDWVARNNYYHDVVIGTLQNMGKLLSFKPCQLSGVGQLTATCTPDSGTHDLVVGQGVRIRSKLNPDTTLHPFYGYFAVKSVTATSFSYEMPTVSGDLPTGPHEFAGAAQVANCSIENNVIETALSRPGYWGRPQGIRKEVPTTQPLAQLPYLFRQVVIRDNVIRQSVEPLDPEHFGIIINGAEKMLAENNTIDVGTPQPIFFTKCGATLFFNNQTSAGKLIQGYDLGKQNFQSEVATAIEDALVLSL